MRLPVEMASLIFQEACVPPSEVPMLLRCRVYNLRCARLRHTHPKWRDIITGDPAFWTRLHIDCWTPPAEILFHMGFVRNLPMEVTMKFDLKSAEYPDTSSSQRSSSPYYLIDSSPCQSDDDYEGSERSSSASESSQSSTSYGNSTSDDSYSDDGITSALSAELLFDYVLHAGLARDCSMAVRHSVDRWTRVCFWSSADIFLGAMLDVLGNVPAPEVVSFIFGCPYELSDLRPCAPLLATPITVFNSFLPSLRDIHWQLVGAPLPYTLPYFGHLRCLCMRDLPHSLWPSIQSLVSALTASADLEELVIGGGGVLLPYGSPLAPHFDMPTLEVVTVYADEDTEPIVRLLLSANCPVLRSFHIHDFDTATWSTMLSNPGLAWNTFQSPVSLARPPMFMSSYRLLRAFILLISVIHLTIIFDT
ncbi:hypothetical protein DFH06DRAFT_1335395 [Mycena polygramma]|nr:hypothetical protein DFH06DRAFT_1335395 [Mycena polygramma]